MEIENLSLDLKEEEEKVSVLSVLGTGLQLWYINNYKFVT